MEAPVFILGLHRSGTTLLYQMLARSECFNILTARHVVCFGDIACSSNGRDGTWKRVQQRFQRLGVSQRDVDAVDVHPDTPEEYGFLLDNLHAGLAITRRHLGVFRYICETVRRDQPPKRTLLLKNPWDFGNAATIQTLIPEARFVFIHRNPLHSLSSLYRLIVSAVMHPSVYLAQLSDPYRAFIDGEFPLRLARTICRSSPGFIVRGIVLHAAHQAARHLRQRAALGAAAMDIHFDALCDRPNETIAAILDLLRLNGARHDYRSMIGPHRSSVASEIASHRDQIIHRLGAYAAAMGYDLPRLFTAAANPMETHPAVANPTASTA